MSKSWIIACPVCGKIPDYSTSDFTHIYSCGEDAKDRYHDIRSYGDTEKQARDNWNKTTRLGSPPTYILIDTPEDSP